MSATLPLNVIRCDGGTQPREAINDAVVGEYAERIAEGDSFPPVTVYYDGSDYWLADGFHRVAAHDEAGRSEIACEVRQGTRRDAVLHSVGANAAHGMRRTNADKHRAVLVLLNDAEWSGWSDREIARRCAVSDKTVAKARAEMAPDTAEFRSMPTRTFVHYKTGEPAQMNVGGIREAAQVRRSLTPALDAVNDPAGKVTVHVQHASDPTPTPPPEKVTTATGDPRRMLVLIRAAIDASYGAETASEADIAAIQTNDMMIAGLRKARDLIDRVIRRHEAGTSRVTA